jgi:hypothetical protein
MNLLFNVSFLLNKDIPTNGFILLANPLPNTGSSMDELSY